MRIRQYYDEEAIKRQPHGVQCPWCPLWYVNWRGDGVFCPHCHRRKRDGLLFTAKWYEGTHFWNGNRRPGKENA